MNPRIPTPAVSRTGFVVVAILTFALSPALAATTWMQGRAFDGDEDPFGFGRDLTLGSGGAATNLIGTAGYFAINDLLPGSRDRFCVGADFTFTACSEERYVSLEPQAGRRLTLINESDLTAWRTAVMMDGDGTLGSIFGVVRDAAGQPVAGATVTITPPSGSLFYFDSTGTPVATGPTDASGRFLVLDATAGDFIARADIGGSTVGLAYGSVVDTEFSGLALAPPLAIGGTVVDESGAGVSGASVSWDFDSAVATASAGGGVWTLPETADGLDLTVRATATGFVEGLTFRRSAAETPDPAAIEVRLLSSATYASLPAAYVIVQSSGLGLFVGRVLDEAGVPAAGAVVSPDPLSGTVRYFGPTGLPDPALTATTSSGKFVVFNVPTGEVVLTATVPTGTIRSAVAPSVAGAVTQGDLVAYETQTVEGTVYDEQFRTTPVGGTLVQVLEFPQLVTIVGADGRFSIPGVPKNTLVSMRAAKQDFVDSYTFRRDSGPDDLRTQDLFIASVDSVTELHTSRGVPFDRSRATVGVREQLSNGEGVIGLTGSTIPVSGTESYPAANQNVRTPGTETSSFGNINVISVFPFDGGFVLVDPRSDFTSFELSPLPENGVVIDNIPIPCDSSPGVLSNLYPCDGSVVNIGADPMDFHWEDDGITTLKFQIQLSTDPSFATIDFSSKNKNNKFLSSRHWRPGKKLWKKIMKLADGGTTVYWRVQQREKVDKKTRIDTFSVPYTFTVE